MGEPLKLPEPGVYEGIADHVYHSWPYASNSRLGKLVPPSTPAHLKAYLDEPQKDRKVFKEGRILHACVLEHERYEREYLIAGQCAGKTKKGVQCSKPGAFPVVGGSAACHLHIDGMEEDRGALIVSPADDAMARGARERFQAHPMAGGFLRVPDAKRELSIVWDQPVDDEGTVVRCKARIDWYSPTFLGGTPMDLKGARDASQREIKKQAHYNGYLRQSVLYRMGLKALGLPARGFAVIAQEKVPPYELMVYMLGDAACGHLPEPGEEPAHVAGVVMASLRLWAFCERTGEYPGYPDGIHDLTTDEWMWSDMDHQTQQINDFLNGRAA